MKKFGHILLCLSLLCYISNQIFSKGFVAGTPVETQKGWIPIEKIKRNDESVSRNYFSWSEMHDNNQTFADTKEEIVNETVRLTFDDGTVLEGTPNQEIVHLHKGWTRLDNFDEPVTYGDKIICKDCIGTLNPTEQERQRDIEKPICVIKKEILHEIKRVHDIYVPWNNNYKVANSRIYAHNFIPLFVIGIEWGLGAGAAGYILWNVAPAVLTLFAGKILTNKEARAWARERGWEEIKDIPKWLRKVIRGKSPAFQDRNTGKIYVPDQTGHGGSAWKEFDK